VSDDDGILVLSPLERPKNEDTRRHIQHRSGFVRFLIVVKKESMVNMDSNKRTKIKCEEVTWQWSAAASVLH
jgi:hypothetical protein